MAGLSTRHARDIETGEAYEIPDNMTYKQWKAAQKGLDKPAESDIIGIETSNGITISYISSHSNERAIEREISNQEIIDALKTPLYVSDVKFDNQGRPSQRFIGQHATVNINPDTGTVTTIWRTGKNTVKKYRK